MTTVGTNIGNLTGRAQCECQRECRCMCHRNGAKHIVACCGPGSGKHEMCADNKKKISPDAENTSGGAPNCS